MTTMQNIIQSKYGNVAESSLSNQHAGVQAVARAFGYSAEELASIPAGANMGLSCGNPIAAASLKPGETVVDLGSGGGLDVFLAAQKVGPAGKAIGIDMTPAMIDRARKNALETGLQNVDFHLAAIDQLPLPSASVDCVISNCVINLAPDKQAVFKEIFRVLKPGGRVAVSDIALKKELPPALATDMLAYVGCIAGAISIQDYLQGLRAAGFSAVHVVDSGADLNAYAQVEGGAACCSPAMEKPKPAVSLTVKDEPCCGPTCCGGTAEKTKSETVHEALATLLAHHNINDYAASVKVFAIKP